MARAGICCVSGLFAASWAHTIPYVRAKLTMLGGNGRIEVEYKRSVARLLSQEPPETPRALATSINGDET